MKYEVTTTGVVAEFEGKYWGTLYADGQVTSNGFGPIQSAKVSDPRYCKHATDMTYEGSHELPYLRRARLVPVTITTIYDVGIPEVTTPGGV